MLSITPRWSWSKKFFGSFFQKRTPFPPGAVLLAGSVPAVAQPAPCVGALSTAQIVGCLSSGPPKTRGFPRMRGVGVEGQEAPADATVNLMVNFDFDSAQLTNDGMIALQALGRALADRSDGGDQSPGAGDAADAGRMIQIGASP